MGDEGGPWLPIGEVARRVGAAAWAERYLYEVVGTWAGTSSAAAVRVFFDAASQHHAWRARLWAERLPGTAARPVAASSPTDLLQPPDEGATAALVALSGLEGDAARLGAYCRVVLPRAVVSYRRWEARCSPLSDGPISRALMFTLSDLHADWEEGSAVLAGLLSSAGQGSAAAGAIAEAAASAAEIERHLLEKGPGEHAG
ncbi:MAG TPA: hypothetical protein VL984_04565 [Acidimicrobiales bacterium]|nr:hypothetical protein [Acidimicrobiales bacterium]